MEYILNKMFLLILAEFKGKQRSWQITEDCSSCGLEKGWNCKNKIHTCVLSWFDLVFDLYLFRTLRYGTWYVRVDSLLFCTSWDFSISRDIAVTDPLISVQESNVIENYHARQKNTKMEKGKMRKKDEEANGTWMAAKSNSMTHLHLLKLINP